ncbi:MAG: energy transducer TonB, partial [Komagataeibacter saccharivorans]
MDRSVQQQDRRAGRLATPFSTMPERPGWRAMAAGWAVLLAILVHGMIGAWLLPRQTPVHEPAGEKNSIQVFFDRPEVAPAPTSATPQPQPQPQHKAPRPRDSPSERQAGGVCTAPGRGGWGGGG